MTVKQHEEFSLVCLSAKMCEKRNRERKKEWGTRSHSLGRFHREKRLVLLRSFFPLLSTMSQTLGSLPQCRSPQSSAPLAILSLRVSVFVENSGPRGPGHTCHERSVPDTHTHTPAYTHGESIRRCRAKWAKWEHEDNLHQVF